MKMGVECWVGKTRSSWTKTCPTVTQFTANPTRSSPGKEMGLRGDRPKTNRMSHGTGQEYLFSRLSIFFFFPAQALISANIINGAETWTLRKVGQNYWEVLKCDDGEGWESVGPIM